MAWVEKDHNDHQVSTPLLCAGSPTSRPGCPEPHPAWPWMPPGMGHPQPPWAACSVPHHPLCEYLPCLKHSAEEIYFRYAFLHISWHASCFATALLCFWGGHLGVELDTASSLNRAEAVPGLPWTQCLQLCPCLKQATHRIFSTQQSQNNSWEFLIPSLFIIISLTLLRCVYPAPKHRYKRQGERDHLSIDVIRGCNNFRYDWILSKICAKNDCINICFFKSSKYTSVCISAGNEKVISYLVFYLGATSTPFNNIGDPCKHRSYFFEVKECKNEFSILQLFCHLKIIRSCFPVWHISVPHCSSEWIFMSKSDTPNRGFRMEVLT